MTHKYAYTGGSLGYSAEEDMCPAVHFLFFVRYFWAAFSSYQFNLMIVLDFFSGPFGRDTDALCTPLKEYGPLLQTGTKRTHTRSHPCQSLNFSTKNCRPISATSSLPGTRMKTMAVQRLPTSVSRSMKEMEMVSWSSSTAPTISGCSATRFVAILIKCVLRQLILLAPPPFRRFLRYRACAGRPIRPGRRSSWKFHLAPPRLDLLIRSASGGQNHRATMDPTSSCTR